MSTLMVPVKPPLWDANPVLALILSWQIDAEELGSFPSQTRTLEEHHPPCDSFSRLGNFDPVLRYLGKPIDVPRKKSSQTVSFQVDSSKSSPTDFYETPASSFESGGGNAGYEQLVKSREVRFANGTKDNTKEGFRTARRTNESRRDLRSLDIEVLACLINSTKPIQGEQDSHFHEKALRRSKRLTKQTHSETPESDVELVTPTKGRHTLPAAANLLTPSWVALPPRPAAALPKAFIASSLPFIPPLDVPCIQVKRSVLQPLLILTKEEKKALLVRKLMKDFPLGPLSNLQNDPIEAITSIGGNKNDDGIHVLIDASNIVIGFANALKVARGLNAYEVTRRPAFDFHSLSVVLERARPASKRVLCGSLDSSDREPDYMAEARSCGYAVSALKRVEKARPVRAAATKRSGGNGYATSGPSSGSDAFFKPMVTNGEQAVDELLHLNMCDSILESSKASTIVLATGDAAEAEYSGGFFKYVELALNKGWNVELVCWKQGMSFAWTNPGFLKKWKGKFSIFLLDPYREELFADYLAPRSVSSAANADWTD